MMDHFYNIAEDYNNEQEHKYQQHIFEYNNNNKDSVNKNSEYSLDTNYENNDTEIFLNNIIDLMTSTSTATTITKTSVNFVTSLTIPEGMIQDQQLSQHHQINDSIWMMAMNTTPSSEMSYTPYNLRPETYIVPIVFAIIFIAGVLGNGTLVIVFMRHRAVRNVPNTYILSLALADLLVIITTVPLTSTVYTVDSWPWGTIMCKLSEFFKDLSIGVSVFTLTALSGDRYFAIVDPLRKFHAHGGGKRATHMTIAIAISIWILAIICGLPALIGSYIKELKVNSNKSFSFCYPFPDQWGEEYARSMVLVRFLIYYAVPLLIIGVFYGLIACHLIYTASVPGEIQGTVRQVRARKKVAFTVLAFVVIFGICFFPSHLFMLWFYYSPTAQEDYNTFWHVLRIVGFCLSFANSCANPVALYFVSGAFRKHFNRYLFCQGPKSGRKKFGDNLGHRDVSLTSTMSRRLTCRRSCHNHSLYHNNYYHRNSTIRRLQETTVTIFPNGTLNINEELECEIDRNL